MIGTSNILRLTTAGLLAGVLAMAGGMAQAAEEYSDAACKRVEEQHSELGTVCKKMRNDQNHMEMMIYFGSDTIAGIQEQSRNLKCMKNIDDLNAAERASCLAKKQELTQAWRAGITALEKKIQEYRKTIEPIMLQCGGIRKKDITAGLPDPVRTSMGIVFEGQISDPDDLDRKVRGALDRAQRTLVECESAKAKREREKASAPTSCETSGSGKSFKYCGAATEGATKKTESAQPKTKRKPRRTGSGDGWEPGYVDADIGPVIGPMIGIGGPFIGGGRPGMRPGIRSGPRIGGGQPGIRGPRAPSRRCHRNPRTGALHCGSF